MIKDIQDKQQPQFPSDWKVPKSVIDIQKVFEAHGFFNGRMISSSKSGYWKKHPNNLIVFNANIIISNIGKVFYGDIDITLDEKALKKVAKCIDQTLYVLREMAGRFGAENRPFDELIAESVWNTDQ